MTPPRNAPGATGGAAPAANNPAMKGKGKLWSLACTPRPWQTVAIATVHYTETAADGTRVRACVCVWSILSASHTSIDWLIDSWTFVLLLLLMLLLLILYRCISHTVSRQFLSTFLYYAYPTTSAYADIFYQNRLVVCQALGRLYYPISSFVVGLIIYWSTVSVRVRVRTCLGRLVAVFCWICAYVALGYAISRPHEVKRLLVVTVLN